MSPELIAAAVQLATAATFVIIAAVAFRTGTAAQRAAEAEVERQGLPAGVLAANKVRFDESAAEALVPLAIAAVLVVLAVLNLTGTPAGRIGSWIFQPILLVVGGYVTVSQLRTTRMLQAAFAKSDDERLHTLNVASFVDAATGAYPNWLRPLQVARLVLVTAGSLLIIILLVIAARNS
ncbi:hypothetical protein [Microlunatus sp. GCM10028923]|uniref:hypothetical protein n=1 Tax=Microlunatus sp. GCM10028923 TaxID=3273400 RepID=UPI003621A3D0